MSLFTASPSGHQRRWLGWLLLVGALSITFLHPLTSLAAHAAKEDLHSHLLLVPFVSAYLLRLQWAELSRDLCSSIGWALLPAALALAAFGASAILRERLSHNDWLALMALSFVAFLWAGTFVFLGRRWMQSAAFPVGFLIFLVPLPDAAVEWLEHASVLGSAETASMFFNLSGTPVLRDGVIFELPGIVLEVAQECSGIRSSWVLLITSLVASHMFLKSPWRRFVLVAFVIPLGLIRNGFRILVIGLLCVHVGPHMVHSIVHKRGGPFFFALSLIPLFLLLWWLRRGESPGKGGQIDGGPTAPTGAPTPP